jgi:hypothetical protein
MESDIEFANTQERNELFDAMKKLKYLQQHKISTLMMKSRGGDCSSTDLGADVS